MNTARLLPVAAIALLSATVIGCSSEDDPFQVPNTSAPTTGTNIADQNSFTLAANVVAAEGLSRTGTEVTFTARAADRHNHPVPDNTRINFLTNGGSIQPSCDTQEGTCSVTWVSQNPVPGIFSPGDPGRAVVVAYTGGEESFNDLNDNDSFDIGETILDLSEPYIDANWNGIRDADEEFVDVDADNTFDGPDGVYTGTSCIGDITVCNRVGLIVWTNRFVWMSGSFATITAPGIPGNVGLDTTVTITFNVVDALGNPMPDDTTIDISATDGSFDPSSIDVASGRTSFDVSYTTSAAGPTSGTDTITVEVTAPESGSISTQTFSISVP